MGTTAGQSITLANSIIGVGILAMPFCFQQCGVLLATLILLVMGLISRLCCYFLLKSAVLARRRNFEFLALHVFGSAGKMAVEVGIIGFLMGTCIAYFVVVGDLGPQIISKMFNINQSNILRTSIMVIVSLVCVLPLGLLRNVDSLSNVSAATICFYVCLVIKVIAEAATQLPSGEWHQRMELWKPQGLLQCVPIFSMALFCQAQLFEIFESLPSLSLEKMNLVTKNAINICSGVYFTLGVFGYIAFSEKEISGNILMSLSPTMASDVIKLGFVMSLAFSFPLIIFPCRASIYSFLYKKVHSSHHDHIINHSIPEPTFRFITIGIIGSALLVSVLLPSIELVLGLLGATIGVLVCLVFPAAAFLNLTYKDTNERVLAKGVVILGLVIMVLGTYANLQAAESQIERYDERFITQEKIDKIVEDFFEKRQKDNNFKPITKNEPFPLDPNKLNGNVMKDSEVQPPNPVPPESNSNELKSPETNLEKIALDKISNNKLVNDVLLPEKLKEEAADTISDTHPKNLKSKLNEARIANGNTGNVDETKEKLKPPVNEANKVEEIKLIKQQQLIETMKQHGEEQKELMQEQKEILDEIIKNKKDINLDKPIEPEQIPVEPKVDENIKHQQLIDTIKQHGEEQKELMKEQKEILHEIKELKQNKDTDSNEAKKIAVESIKQIADMAIKSIGGVTDKPAGEKPNEVKKAERLEKLTNEAVQEIAKKAVETIEAIQEIKESPEAAKPIVGVANIKVENEKAQEKQLAVNPEVKPFIAANVKVENEKAQVQPAAVIPEAVRPFISAPVMKLENGKAQEYRPAVISNKETVLNAEAPAANLNVQNNQNEKPHQANMNRELLSNIAPVEELKQSNDKKIVNKVAPIPNILAINQNEEIKPIIASVGSNNVKEKDNPKNNELKPHSHSPDEPQSYKLGEDTQVEKQSDKLNHNVPLAVAMSDKAKLENNAEANAKSSIINSEIKQNIINIDRANVNVQAANDAKESIVPKVANLVREKRDVVDCTQIVTLETVERNLCKTLQLLPIENAVDILPKVDLNDRLSKMPLNLDLHHIGRSLKSYDEIERKR